MSLGHDPVKSYQHVCKIWHALSRYWQFAASKKFAGRKTKPGQKAAAAAAGPAPASPATTYAQLQGLRRKAAYRQSQHARAQSCGSTDSHAATPSEAASAEADESAPAARQAASAAYHAPGAECGSGHLVAADAAISSDACLAAAMQRSACNEEAQPSGTASTSYSVQSPLCKSRLDAVPASCWADEQETRYQRRRADDGMPGRRHSSSAKSGRTWLPASPQSHLKMSLNLLHINLQLAASMASAHFTPWQHHSVPQVDSTSLDGIATAPLASPDTHVSCNSSVLEPVNPSSSTEAAAALRAGLVHRTEDPAHEEHPGHADALPANRQVQAQLAGLRRRSALRMAVEH